MRKAMEQGALRGSKALITDDILFVLRKVRLNTHSVAIDGIAGHQLPYICILQLSIPL